MYPRHTDNFSTSKIISFKYPFSSYTAEMGQTDLFFVTLIYVQTNSLIDSLLRTKGKPTLFKNLAKHVGIRDENGHVGPDVKGSKEVTTAICGAIILAKLSIVPVRHGYWGTRWASHTRCPARGWAAVTLCWCTSPLPPEALPWSQPLCPRGYL